MSFRAQLRRIADDPAWSPVYRMAAKQAAVEMPDGSAMSDREVHAMLRQRVVAQCAEPGRPDSIERLRARLQPVADRLGVQETDPGVWDDIAAENAALAPARARAIRLLLSDDPDKKADEA
ncbi:hypothetical protein [Micromonospora sediminicola]|uniref:hypothetical protein n=1 Tax=Micromonospora sediminicola TaxID=946078 RepID=UPI0037A4FAC4